MNTLQNTMAIYLRGMSDEKSWYSTAKTAKLARAKFLLVRNGKAVSEVPTVNCQKLFDEHDGEDTHTDRPIYSQSFDDLFTDKPLENWICPNLTNFEIGKDYGLAVRVVTCSVA